ncbi:MAG: hypothetical protein ABFC94_06120 [Syntrophomonas sp.]
MHEQPTRKQLTSKKNYVCWEQGEHGDKVIKAFTDQSRFQMEKKMGDLVHNSGLLTPCRLSVNEENLVIIYEYVDGSPVVDLIESIELSQAEDIIRKICAWLVNFYSITLMKMGCQYILGDIHLRNFLYEQASNKVYGFDFEECRPGRIETDAARLYTFILHYDPAFTSRKKALVACFWETLSASLVLDETFFQQEVKRETAELMARRRCNRSLG